MVPAAIGLELRQTPVTTGPVVGSPAARAGFLPGDSILAIGEKPVTGSTEFVAAIAAMPPGATVRVTVSRNGQETVLTATLDAFAPATAPADGKPAAPRGRLGLPVRNAVVVESITSGGLAEKAGVRPGDRIESINMHSVDSVDEAAQVLGNARYRGRATIALRRDGQPSSVGLDLGAPVAYVPTADDEARAAGEFKSLAGLHKMIDADIAEGNSTAPYLLDDGFYSGTVAKVFPDVPKPGQAVVAFTTPGDHTRNGDHFAGANVVWKDKGLVAGWAPGRTVYFRGSLVKIVPKEGEARLREMLLEGREPYATPGLAFNAARPALRSPTTVPTDAVAISDVVEAVRSDAAKALAQYKGKRMLFRGVAQQLMRSGEGTYDIYFYSAGKPAAEEHFVRVRLKGDLGGALKGFKRGETLWFRGSVATATVETTEVDNFLDGGKTRKSRVNLVFELETMYLAKTPL